uniref:Putative LOC101237786 [Hydra vulgaris] n=1 Tax=Lepeophtheirus salmonis TaxID=72036 RepID=A0A0K2TJ19_LEPSM
MWPLITRYQPIGILFLGAC